VAAQRELVHVGAGDLELLANLVGLLAHVLARERIAEAVVDHAVERRGVPHPEAEARLLEQVGRLRHRLHPAGDSDLQIPGANRLVHDAGGAQPRGADLVHGLGGDVLGDPRLDLCLPARDLSLPRLQHLPEDNVFHLVGRHLRALQGGGDRGAAVLGCV
jgi:hypothetical protein